MAIHQKVISYIETEEVSTPNLQKNPACPLISFESPMKKKE